MYPTRNPNPTHLLLKQTRYGTLELRKLTVRLAFKTKSRQNKTAQNYENPPLFFALKILFRYVLNNLDFV